MENKKMVAGIFTLLGLGIVVSLIIASNKNNGRGKSFLKKSKRLASDLKGKFVEFVDQLSE
jgi:uncharacterized protein YxeA